MTKTLLVLAARWPWLLAGSASEQRRARVQRTRSTNPWFPLTPGHRVRYEGSRTASPRAR